MVMWAGAPNTFRTGSSVLYGGGGLVLHTLDIMGLAQRVPVEVVLAPGGAAETANSGGGGGDGGAGGSGIAVVLICTLKFIFLIIINT